MSDTNPSAPRVVVEHGAAHPGSWKHYAGGVSPELRRRVESSIEEAVSGIVAIALFRDGEAEPVGWVRRDEGWMIRDALTVDVAIGLAADSRVVIGQRLSTSLVFSASTQRLSTSLVFNASTLQFESQFEARDAL